MEELSYDVSFVLNDELPAVELVVQLEVVLAGIGLVVVLVVEFVVILEVEFVVFDTAEAFSVQVLLVEFKIQLFLHWRHFPVELHALQLETEQFEFE